MATTSRSPDQETTAPAWAVSIAIAGILAVVALYIFLTAAIGFSEFYIGLLFFTYWTQVQKSAVGQIVPSVLGSVLGVSVGFLVVAETTALTLTGLAAVAALVFVFVFERLRIVVNTAMFLTITLVTIPVVGDSATYVGCLVALGLAVVIFACPVAAMSYLKKTRNAEV